jgi:hypothetical protein
VDQIQSLRAEMLQFLLRTGDDIRAGAGGAVPHLAPGGLGLAPKLFELRRGKKHATLNIARGGARA